MMKQAAVASQRHAAAKTQQELAKEAKAHAEALLAESARRKASSSAQEMLERNTEVRFTTLYTREGALPHRFPFAASNAVWYHARVVYVF
jgi:hypothetical protein